MATTRKRNTFGFTVSGSNLAEIDKGISTTLKQMIGEAEVYELDIRTEIVTGDEIKADSGPSIFMTWEAQVTGHVGYLAELDLPEVTT